MGQLKYFLTVFLGALLFQPQTFAARKGACEPLYTKSWKVGHYIDRVNRFVAQKGRKPIAGSVGLEKDLANDVLVSLYRRKEVVLWDFTKETLDAYADSIIVQGMFDNTMADVGLFYRRNTRLPDSVNYQSRFEKNLARRFDYWLYYEPRRVRANIGVRIWNAVIAAPVFRNEERLMRELLESQSRRPNLDIRLSHFVARHLEAPSIIDRSDFYQQMRSQLISQGVLLLDRLSRLARVQLENSRLWENILAQNPERASRRVMLREISD